MTKLLKKILFKSVLVVMLLHTFIPHPHSEEMTEKEHIALHKNPNTLFKIISLAFHDNIDENLIVAQYNIVEKDNIACQNSTSALLYSTFSVVENTPVEKIAPRNTNCSNSIFIVTLNGERGPPLSA